MFAWLMVHWSLAAESIWLEMLVSGILYLALLAVIEVVSNALDAELVFADPAGSRLVPVDKWMQAFVEPLIGAGLIFLLWRDLMQESRLSGGDPVLFALTALFVLFAVAVVGLGVEIGFSRRRGKKTQMGVKMSKTVKKVGSLNLKTLIESMLKNSPDDSTLVIERQSIYEGGQPHNGLRSQFHGAQPLAI